MTETLIDHVSIDIGIRIESPSISRIVEAVTLLLSVLSLFCTLLAYLLNFLDLILPLEILFFNVSNPINVLLFQVLKLIHAHIHYVLASIGISNHLTHVMRKLIEINSWVLIAST